MLIYVEHINNKHYIKIEIYHDLYMLKMRMLILNGVRIYLKKLKKENLGRLFKYVWDGVCVYEKIIVWLFQSLNFQY